MGLAGLVLKKRENVDISCVIRDVKLAAKRAELEIRVDSELYESWGAGVYTTANIADTFEDRPNAQQWLMYVYSDDVDYERFDMVQKGGKLIRIMNIENFSECEKMLLDFLYEYLKLNPEDYFWDELDWFYTYEDIVKIKQREFDPNWCYKNPHLENEVSG